MLCPSLRLAFVAAFIVPALGLIPARAQTSVVGDSACASAVEGWQEFATQENQGGHMDPPVFQTIQAEINHASDLCQSGHDAEARKTIEQSKRRHGY